MLTVLKFWNSEELEAFGKLKAEKTSEGKDL
jgi:hypothetical protein